MARLSAEVKKWPIALRLYSNSYYQVEVCLASNTLAYLFDVIRMALVSFLMTRFKSLDDRWRIIQKGVNTSLRCGKLLFLFKELTIDLCYAIIY